MIEKFNSCNIIWYAPEKSEKVEKWKAFSNTEVYKVTNETQLLTFLKYDCKNIIIATGKYAERLFSQKEKKDIFLFSFLLFKSFIIIYCMNSEYHKNWSKEIPLIIGVTTKPNQIFEILLKFQKKYVDDLCLFGYQILNSKIFNFNMNINDINNHLVFDSFSLKLNMYEKLCLSIFFDFFKIKDNPSEFLDFRCAFSNLINLFYGETIDDFPYMPQQLLFIILRGKDINGPPIELLMFFQQIATISFCVSKFPYLYGCLNYNEIEMKLHEKITKNDLIQEYKKIRIILFIIHRDIILYKTLNFKENAYLKELHLFLIDFIKINTTLNSLFKYPLLIRYLSDLDFCLKYFFKIVQKLIRFNKFSSLQSNISFAFSFVDKRIDIFETYINMEQNEKEY